MPRWLWSWAQALWFALGLSAAAIRVATQPGQPDTTTLGFLVFAVLALLAPAVKNISFPGGGGIDFKEEIAQASQTIEQSYRQAITDLASLLRSLTGAESRLQAVFQLTTVTQADAYSFALQTCQDAIAVSTRWLVPTTDESMRAVVWWYDVSSGSLSFVLTTDSNAASLAEVEVTVDDDDSVGDAFRNARVGNYSDAPDAFRSPQPPGAPRYKGIMFVPIIFGARVVGIAEFDRAQPQRFDANAEIVASALANFVGYVMTHPRVGLPFLK
jgi:GAF domain-containing protein